MTPTDWKTKKELLDIISVSRMLKDEVLRARRAALLN